MQNPDLKSNKFANGTEAVAQETAGALSGALLATLLEANRDGVIALDAEDRLSVINRQALHYLNFPGVPEDWLEHKLMEISTALRIYAPEAIGPLRRELQRYSCGDETRGEGEFRTEYGIIHWLNLPMRTSAPTRSSDTSAGRLIILYDVTSQRQSTIQRHDLSRLLMDDLHRPLKRVTETIQYMAAGNRVEFPSALHQALLAALDDANGALAAVCEFIDLARLESGQMPLSMSAFQLTELVDWVLELEQPVAQQKELKLEQCVAQSLPRTWGDRGLIQRLFKNLVYGVLAVTPPGGTVRVEANASVTDYDKIMISIADSRMSTVGAATAPGARRMCVLETSPPYHRPATLRDLSFAFCRKVVEAHGERIWVLHSQSSGTAVTFTLPQVSESLVSVGISAT